MNLLSKVICVDQHETEKCNTASTAQMWCNIIADKIAKLRCYRGADNSIVRPGRETNYSDRKF